MSDSIRQGEKIPYECTDTSTTYSRKTTDPILDSTQKINGMRPRANNEIGRKEQAIYYLSKKFIDYESKYSSLEKMCCALA